MRWRKNPFVVAALLVLGSCVVGFAGLVWLVLAPTTPVPLTRDLGDSMPDRDPLFASRVTTAFPAGMSHDAIRATLRTNGFELVAGPEPQGRTHTARRKESSFPCEFTFLVSWTESEAGALTSVQGRLFPNCL